MYATQRIFPEITNVKPSQNWLKCSRAVRICMVHIKIYFEDFWLVSARCVVCWFSPFMGHLFRRLRCSRDCCKRKDQMWVVLLPPANEVWGKVMFSQVFVCPQGGWLASQHASKVTWPGGSASGGVLHPRGLQPGLSASRRVCIQRDLYPSPEHYRIR